MSLTTAMNTAQSIFNNTGTQTSVLSKNLSNSENPNYVRRSAVLSTTLYGAEVVTTERAQNLALLRQTIVSSSDNSGQQKLLTGLEQIRSTLGGDDYEMSPASYIAKLRNSLQDFQATPGNATFAAATITAAQDVAKSLNQTTTQLQEIRTQADRDIATDVGKLNNLLGQFKIANDAIVQATAVGLEANDALDQRDTVLKQISEIVGISTVTRTNNDMVLYTSDGTTLFEKLPRAVTFQSTTTLTATSGGNAVYIDGVALDAGKGANTSAQGTLAASLQLRDDIAPMFQTQLDEIARGLVTVFAEVSNNPAATKATGLFTWSGAPAIPAAGASVAGLASTITVNPALTLPGGSPTLLRDGGINGAAYVWNSAGASYTARLDHYITGLDGDITFDSDTGLESTSSVLEFANNSIGWLEGTRSNADAANEAKFAMLVRSTDAYSSQTGVSVDEELTLLLDVEQSYKAATKLVSAIDEMLKSLMEIAS